MKDESVIYVSAPLPKEFAERVKKRAKSEERTVAAIIRLALQAYLAS
jgi:predicted DNA-binding protein